MSLKNMKKTSFFIIAIFTLTILISACTSGPKKIASTESQNIQNEQIKKALKWKIYENKDRKFKFKYLDNLAYVVDTSLRYEGYEMYLGFSEEEDISRGENGYPVEFVVIPEQKESEYVNGEKYIAGVKKGEKYYYFSTYEMDKYGKVVDEMAETLEFIN